MGRRIPLSYLACFCHKIENFTVRSWLFLGRTTLPSLRLFSFFDILPKMLENGYGKIINVSSIAGVYGKADMAHYSATKGAVISLTKALAKEVIGSGVCVNCVSPGTVSPAENPDMDYYESDERSYAGRTGTDNENASLICFLASDDADYIVGQNIQIDGCRKIL